MQQDPGGGGGGVAVRLHRLQQRLEAIRGTLETTHNSVGVFLETQEALNLVRHPPPISASSPSSRGGAATGRTASTGRVLREWRKGRLAMGRRNHFCL
jgi:hypothetical protein